MLRVAIASAAVGAASAGLAEECKQGLIQLGGQSDFELAAQCRSAFAPEVCREARRYLGAQPWSEARMEDSCSKFASAFQGKDVRSLEQAMAQKSTAPVDTSTAAKAPTPTEKPKQQGLIAGLLDKLKDGKKDGNKKPSHPAPPKNPVEAYFDQLKNAQKEEEKKKGPLAAFLSQMGDKKKQEDVAQKPGPVADFFKQLEKKPEAQQSKDNKPNPVADFLKKMAADKAKEQAKKMATDHMKKMLVKDKPMKLYEDHVGEETSPSTFKLAGAGVAVAAFSALALMVTRFRRSSAPTVQVE